MTDVERKELETKGYFKGDMRRVCPEDLVELYPDCWLLFTNLETYPNSIKVKTGQLYEITTIAARNGRVMEFDNNRPEGCKDLLIFSENNLFLLQFV